MGCSWQTLDASVDAAFLDRAIQLREIVILLRGARESHFLGRDTYEVTMTVCQVLSAHRRKISTVNVTRCTV